MTRRSSPSAKAQIAVAILLLAASLHAAGAQRAIYSDTQIVDDATLVATGRRVELYQHGGIRVDAAFLQQAEEACVAIESLLGRALDTATPGERIRIYVSDAVLVSHVWGAYAHRNDPRPIAFLNTRAYLGAVQGGNATYIHELTHLYSWRYSSHTLREGLADYIALRVRPGAAVGPNSAGYAGVGKPSKEIIDHLATTRPPPGWVSTSPDQRRAYYYASYRVVKHLVEKRGMETFMRLYESPDPEAELPKLYGEDRAALVQAALSAP